MANLRFKNPSKRITSRPITTDDVDSTAIATVGEETTDASGNVFQYVSGVANCAAGSWVTIGASGAITLLASGASGPVGVAMSAIVAAKYGWVQVKGYNSIALASSNGTIASGGGQLQVGGSGLVAAQGTSTGAAAGDYIFGAFAYSAQPVSESTGADLITVFLNYPMVAVAVAVASS